MKVLIAATLVAMCFAGYAQAQPTDQQLQDAFKICRARGYQRPVINQKHQPANADDEFTQSCRALWAEIDRRAAAAREASKDTDRQAVKDLAKRLQ